MTGRLHKSKGIVLRAVKFGETSLIVTIYTELFGIQSYIVNGVRLHTRKGAGKANLFQSAAILDLVVYHHESARLNRIREFQWHYLYEKIFSDVKKNAIALFMVELLTRCLKQPEPNPDLFAFIEDSFITLDSGSDAVSGNFALFFSLHLASFLGSRIDDNYSEKNIYLDLVEGSFVSSMPSHPHFLEGQEAYMTSQLLKVQQASELGQLKMNHQFRRNLLYAYEKFYALHVPDFGSMKTISVLKEILS